MTPLVLTFILMTLICWNGFLHARLSEESHRRRELTLAFRQAGIERRQR